MSDEPFGRQPEPITVRLFGEPEDIKFWIGRLIRAAEFKGDNVQKSIIPDSFIIYPRAVND